MDKEITIIIGAGPAGLTAAYELDKKGLKSKILEATHTVGGISQTVNYKGNRFDIGGHRFFSKVAYVNELWDEILGDHFLIRERLSRIHYKNIFFDYPLKPGKALLSLGPIEAIRIGFSYLKAMTFPSKEEEKSFEDWVVNRFGYRLYSIFFKTYTEKVWGIPCNEISSDWASQRIKNLSLKEAVLGALRYSNKKDGEIITSLIEEFKYPRLGPGMMWEYCQRSLNESGNPILLGHKVTAVYHESHKVNKIDVSLENGVSKSIAGDHFISSMPLKELLNALRPLPPNEVLDAANSLRYRDYLTVVLIVDRPVVFPDNWIYIHTPEVKLGRIQNYKNWSPEMVDNEKITTLGLEYFLWEKDEEWNWTNEKLIELGIKECVKIGIIGRDEVLDGTVVRMKKAYPVYDHEYSKNLEVIKDYISLFENLQAIGRNGQHRYNNQDHSMMTGVLAARNITGEKNNIWSVNVEKVYHEEGKVEYSKGDRMIPKRNIKYDDSDSGYIFDSFESTLDSVALGGALGITATLFFFIICSVLIIKGGDPIGPNLSLLKAYLVGFEVNWKGAFIGSLEVGIIGFGLGYLIGTLRNLANAFYINVIHKKLSIEKNKDIMDQI